jgi:hypothetical protein
VNGFGSTRRLSPWPPSASGVSRYPDMSTIRRRGWMRAITAASSYPTHAGHAVVGDDQAESPRPAAKDRQRRLRVGRFRGFVALALQQPHDDAANGGLVVHDEDGRRRACGAGVCIEVRGRVDMRHGATCAEPYGVEFQPICRILDGQLAAPEPGLEIVARTRPLLHL